MFDLYRELKKRLILAVVVFLVPQLLIGCSDMEDRGGLVNSMGPGSTTTSQASEDAMAEFGENNLLAGEKKLISTDEGDRHAGAEYRALTAALMDKPNISDLDSPSAEGDVENDGGASTDKSLAVSEKEVAEKLECGGCQKLISGSKFEEKFVNHARWIMAFYADGYVKPFLGTSFLKFSEESRSYAKNAVTIEVACYAETAVYLAYHLKELEGEKLLPKNEQPEGLQDAIDATKKNQTDIRKAYNDFYVKNNKLMDTAGKLATWLLKEKQFDAFGLGLEKSWKSWGSCKISKITS